MARIKVRLYSRIRSPIAHSRANNSGNHDNFSWYFINMCRFALILSIKDSAKNERGWLASCHCLGMKSPLLCCNFKTREIFRSYNGLRIDAGFLRGFHGIWGWLGEVGTWAAFERYPYGMVAKFHEGKFTKSKGWVHINMFSNQASFFYGTIYMPTIMFTKLSIICFYLRLSPYRLFHWICFFMIGIIVAWGVGFTFTSIFMCSPIKAAWEIQPFGTRVKCVDLAKTGMVLAISNAIIDTIILLLPIPMIWHLKLSTRKKLAVYALLGLGGLWVFAII